MFQYVWQHENWPYFRWDADAILRPLGKARKEQGFFLGKVKDLDPDESLRTFALAIEEDSMQTAAIEGELLDRESVRSSIARHLGLDHGGLRPKDRKADGLVQVLLDATRNYAEVLTEKRMFAWHAALFPDGYSDLRQIYVGAWRDVPMQVVSGPMGRRKIHYEAPPPESLEKEMQAFFLWWKKDADSMDGLIRAALAHLYFVTIHPFEDGNGRIARSLCDMTLARDEKTGMRFYSLSAQIMKERKAYYEILEKTQKGNGDCTEWLLWFLGCFERAVGMAENTLSLVRIKTKFWNRNRDLLLNERQKKVLNRLLDAGPGGFEGGLTTRKYMGMTGTSRTTAWREIDELLQKGLLRILPKGGRSTAYELLWEENGL